MRISRVALSAGLAFSGAMLAGCEKPAPGVTVFSGTNSERVSALCWAFDGKALSSGECAQDIVSGDQIGNAPELRVQAGNVVGISVDPAVADAGWVPAIAGQRLVNQTINETYYRFTFPPGQLPEQGVGLQVLAGSGADLRGVWAVRLVG